MNNLKKYVEVNREAFEVYDYTPEDWNDIARKLDQKTSKQKHVSIPLRYLWRVSAMIVLALGSTFYWSWSNLNHSNQNYMISELEEAEYYYNNLIDLKVAQISNIDVTARVEVSRDLEALDQAFTELKSDLRDNADNEEVIHAMIENYKIKLEVLEQILAQLEERKEL